MFPLLIKVNEAHAMAAAISDAQERGSTAALISATKQFFQEQPSQLTVSFDVKFLAEIFQGRFREIRAMWRGEYHDVFDELPDERLPIPIPDPRVDVGDYGVRDRQAYNYAVVHRSEQIRDVLLILSTAALTRPNPKIRRGSGLLAVKPERPVDHLFLVMAADYALRPGQELARLLSEE